MQGEGIVALFASGLELAVRLSLPALGVGLVVGILTAILQSMTQTQDPVVAHVPRVLGGAVALSLTGAWVGAELVTFARAAWSGIEALAR